MFNDNDFGLFYQYLPDKIYSLERKKCFGGKKSKLKVIRMTAAIAIREKLPLFIIDKLKNPRFFKMLNICPTNISQEGRVGWTVKSSTTGSVNLIRNSTWMIALIIGNCPAHPSVSNLTSIQFVFFPPSNTPFLRSMNQRVIRSYRAHYRGKFVRLLGRKF